MKKILSIIIFLFLINITTFGQSWWTPDQEDSIDSLKASILSLGTVSLPSLSKGYIWVGDNANYPASRLITGDFTIDYLGVGAIGNAKITNIMIYGGIDATKISGGAISNTEFNQLDGIRTDMTIQQQFNGLVIGSGFITSYGTQTVTTDLKFSSNGITLNDNLYLSLGTSQNFKLSYNFVYLRSEVLSSNRDLYLYTTGSTGLYFGTNNLERWYINSSGHFLPNVTNSYDIGTSSIRLRNLYTTSFNISGTSTLGSNTIFGTAADASATDFKIKNAIPLTTGVIGYSTTSGESGFYIGDLYMPDDVEVDNQIDKKVNLGTFSLANNVINLDGNNRFMRSISGNTTFTISNIAQTTFDLLITSSAGATITVTAPAGYTIEWILGDSDRTFGLAGDYKFSFEVWGTKIKAFKAY